MNNESYFHSGPSLRFSRTLRDMPFQHTTAYNVGDIVPLMVEQIYPGDSFKTKLSFLTRMFTPVAPLMSNIYQDFYAFFIPWRIVWDHTKQFFGENETGAWTETLDHIVPQHPLDADSVSDGTEAAYPTGGGVGHTPGTAGWDDENGNLPPGSIGDYMGLLYTASDVAGAKFSVSDLFLRAYLQVYNDWFRDENIIAPVLFSKGDTMADGETVFYWSSCLKAAKFHDYFTSLLPEPMKGPTPIVGEDAPVITGDARDVSDVDGPGLSWYVKNNGSDDAVWRKIDTVNEPYGFGMRAIGGAGKTFGNSISAASTNAVAEPNVSMQPANLWSVANITIEDIRRAAVMTHVFERLAACGSRYPEFLQGMWGVVSPDASLQVSEYLGGVRFPIQIQEVLSNSDTLNSEQTSGQPIGSTGAMSKTPRSGALFNKSFTEYGILLVVGVARVEQTYFQGIPRKFINKSFFDFYLPAAANLGYQPVYQEELYLNDVQVLENGFNKVVFGYSEAWAYLRYMPYRLSSIMKPNAEFSLSAWTATEIIDDETSLDQTFIQQPATGLDRTLALSSANRGSFQFFGDFKFDNRVARILPPHSEPGLTRI